MRRRTAGPVTQRGHGVAGQCAVALLAYTNQLYILLSTEVDGPGSVHTKLISPSMHNNKMWRKTELHDLKLNSCTLCFKKRHLSIFE